ncbi:MAG: glutathione S-transferase family protein [Neomegalonema sp.]|nr:glutathione S-transferase family protein [Neomegalonema sp.]
MYKVIGYPRTRVMRVLWLLEELGVAYDLDPATPTSAQVIERYSEGKIPVLETPDGVLTDSVAIMTYLADKHGDPATGPAFAAGSYERGVQDGHTQFIVDELEGALWATTRHLRKDEAEQSPAFVAEMRAQFDRGIERLVARVGAGPFLMGERFTTPDILAGHAAAWAKIVNFDISNEAALAYLGRVASRPSAGRARERAVAAMQAQP